MLKVLKNTVVYTAIVIVAIYLSVWAFSPFAASYFISQYLEEHQLELAEESTLRYNPFLSKLTIDNLAVNNNSESVLTLSSLTFELSAYQLLSNEVNVSEFLIDGLFLSVNKQEDSLTVAGIKIPSSNREMNVDESNTAKEIDKAKAVELALQLIMPNMRLINSTIEITEVDKTHSLELKDVAINVTKITPTLQNLSLTLLAEFNNAEVSLSASTMMVNEQGDIDFKVDVKEIDLHKFNYLFAPQVSIKNGLVSYKGQHKVKLMKDGLRLEIADFGFSTQGVEISKNDIHFALGEQDFNSDLLTIELLNDSKLIVAGGGDLHWQDVSVFNKTSNQVLLALAQFGLKDVGIYVENGPNADTEGKTTDYRITIDSTSLTDSFFSNNTEDEIPALTLFSGLMINDIELTNKKLIIDAVELAGLKSNVQLDQDKQIKNLIMTLEELSQIISGGSTELEITSEGQLVDKTEGKVIASSADIEADNDLKNPKEKLEIQLNRFSLVDSANVQFTDQSVSPHYARYIKINELNAGPFDTEKPNQNTLVTVKGISNNYTSFDFVVNTKPFLEKPEYQLNGTLKQMDLESLTAYVKQALGYEIESGQLDLDVNVQLIGTKINGNSHILLRGIELSSLEDYENKETSNQSYIPFNTALGMLKDSDGNVDLDLPISGDTSSPSFGLSGFLTLIVKRATIAGAKEYLTMTFVPYASLVKIVLAADKHLLKLEISNLNYQPTVVEVSEEQEAFLTTFADLLKDKTDLQIKLCGVSNAEDLGKSKGSKLNRDEIETLINISEQRGNNFKKYMVEEKEISSSRLLLCKPRINNGVESIPHIRFET